MAQPNLHQPTSVSIGLPSARPGLWAALCDLIAVWHSRAKQRQELADLEPRALRDLGLSKAEAASESAKPFWRP